MPQDRPFLSTKPRNGKVACSPRIFPSSDQDSCFVGRRNLSAGSASSEKNKGDSVLWLAFIDSFKTYQLFVGKYYRLFFPHTTFIHEHLACTKFDLNCITAIAWRVQLMSRGLDYLQMGRLISLTLCRWPTIP